LTPPCHYLLLDWMSVGEVLSAGRDGSTTKALLENEERIHNYVQTHSWTF
jgi:hypothetical protein